MRHPDSRVSRCHALYWSDRVSIAVEDWDDLDDAPRQRGGRKDEEGPAAVDPTVAPRLTAPPPETTAVAAALRISAAAEVISWDTLEPAPAPARAAARAAEPEPAPEPERVLGLAQFEDDDYGEVTESLRVPACIAIVNLLVWCVGLFAGVVECIGVAFFVSIGLLLAAYLTREAQRDRTALILLAGAIPLPITIIGLFF
jgi:hypothetical protein